MADILNEILVMALLFGLVWFYALKKSKHSLPSKQEKEALLDKFSKIANLKNLANAKDLKELCMANTDKIYIFSKDTTQLEFLEIIKPFLSNEQSSIKAKNLNVSADFITLCAKSLQEPLVAAFLQLGNKKFALFIYKQNEILELADIANSLGESMLFAKEQDV